MPKTKDITGRRFGFLLAVRLVKTATRVSHNTIWECQCDCGKTSNVTLSNLTNGRTISCGCYRVTARKTHGHTKTGWHSLTYGCWINMKSRCFNPRHTAYKEYGGRGITVCERWMKFENFLADMGEIPQGLTIERVDNNGNYEPSNCKWVTRMVQMNNTRFNVKMTYRGLTFSQSQWARVFGVPGRTLANKRLINGMSIDQIAEYFISNGRWDGVIKGE